MSLIRLSLVGCGNIASEICEAVRDGRIRAEITGLTDMEPGRAERLREQFQLNHAVVGDLETVAGAADLLVEAASVSAVAPVLETAIRMGMDCLIMSLGGLIFRTDLMEQAQKAGVRVWLPSGAVCGLDGIRAAKEAGLDSVTLTTRKPPRGLAGAPWVVEHGIDLGALTEATVIFEGNALDAVRAFPANVNVAAALSLAGIGPEKTRVRVIADPAATENSHEIEAKGPFGELRAVTRNRPSPNNPKTSYLASLSAIHELRRAAELWCRPALKSSV
ncbi:MAG TPA: aspartate dehydrogenase [Candidatus Hydrogenedentes bacterium]|nr:aspartate dehydrogenase [Candidatus Hydrogenedentota bacterium]HPU96514.1 aspartate dehydrogenase [Candidatus Hydrogenedentota bacterium]